MAEAFMRKRIRSRMPTFTYTGSYELIDQKQGDWKLRLLTSGTLTFTGISGKLVHGIDVFLVGGGGNGAHFTNDYSQAGGGGGYTRTEKNITVTKNTEYGIVVGGATQESTAFGYKAAGGGSGWIDSGSGQSGYWWQGVHGNGGSGGWGGVDGGNGSDMSKGGGHGQKSQPGPNGETGTTREFGEPAETDAQGRTWPLYSYGGSQSGVQHDPNTGNGGWPYNWDIGGENEPGCTGIVVIRNHRE